MYIHQKSSDIHLLGQQMEEKSKGCHTPRGSREARVHWQRQPGDPWSGNGSCHRLSCSDCCSWLSELDTSRCKVDWLPIQALWRIASWSPQEPKKTVQEKTKQLRFGIVMESLPVAERYGICHRKSSFQLVVPKDCKTKALQEQERKATGDTGQPSHQQMQSGNLAQIATKGWFWRFSGMKPINGGPWRHI